MASIRVFVSYSHKDQPYLDEDSLLGMLSGLSNEGVDFWTDHEIEVGTSWDAEIRSNLEAADIALVLVSQAFLDSDYCTNTEVRTFIERRQKEGLIIFPVILSPCEWERHEWLSSTQFLPTRGQTIEEHFVETGPRKRLFLEIRQQLRCQVEKIAEARRTAAAAEEQESGVEEKRLLTVLRARLTLPEDPAGFEDPEDLLELEHELAPRFVDLCTRSIEAYEGYVARANGNEVLAYFGFPHDHEDDAVRATLAALDISAAMESSDRLDRLEAIPSVRIGIDTGTAIVAVGARPEMREPMLPARTLETAGSLMERAEPGEVLVSSGTVGILRGRIECERKRASPGSPPPFRALRPREPRHGTASSLPQGRTPLFGRDHELSLLTDRWEQVTEGSGQVIMITGEAGVGKSKLVETFKEAIAERGRSPEYRCSPYHSATAFYPVIRQLSDDLGLDKAADPASKLEILRANLEDLELSSSQALSLFASLLSIPVAADAPSDANAKRQKQQLMHTLLESLLLLAEQDSILLTVEDLHWADPSTLELMTLLLDELPASRILALFTFRPEFLPPWRVRSNMSQISLKPLTEEQTRALLDHLVDGKQIPDTLALDVIAKTDGMPLFVEELTKMVLESGLVEDRGDRLEISQGETTLPIPTTLKESLAARLSRLGSARLLAQVAAVIGRSFSRELLRAVSTQPEESFDEDLRRLHEAEIVLRRSVGRKATYTFKHALIQDAAYESMLKKTRRQCHERIAVVLEASFPEIAESQPELVAKHYTSAGKKRRAVRWWLRAGQRSIRQSANLESIESLRQGLAILDTCPDTEEWRRERLLLQTSLGVPLTATKGYAAPEVDASYTRALELCREVGSPAQLAEVLYGSWRFYLVRAELTRAKELADELAELAEELDDSTSRVGVHRALATTFFYLGDFGASLSHAEDGFAHYDEKLHGASNLFFVCDPGVTCLSYGALALWNLGRTEEAVAQSEESIDLARRSEHAHSIVVALFFDCLLQKFRGDGETALVRAEEQVSLATEHAFSFWCAAGVFSRAWARYELGRTQEGLEGMELGLASWRATGARLVTPFWLHSLASARHREGELEESLSLVDEGLEMAEESGEIWWQPELLRLRSELLLEGNGDAEEARAARRRSLELARSLGARAQEERAAAEA